MSTEQAVAADVFAALEAGQLDLHILPDKAFKIRNMFDNPSVSADHLVRLLSPAGIGFSQTGLEPQLAKVGSANLTAISEYSNVPNNAELIQHLSGIFS